MRSPRAATTTTFCLLAVLSLACSTGTSDQSEEATTESPPASSAAEPTSAAATTPAETETSAAADPNADPVLTQADGTWSSNGGITIYNIYADGQVWYLGAGTDDDFEGIAEAVENKDRPNYYEAVLQDDYGMTVLLSFSYDAEADILSVNFDTDGSGDWVECTRFYE